MTHAISLDKSSRLELEENMHTDKQSSNIPVILTESETFLSSESFKLDSIQIANIFDYLYFVFLCRQTKVHGFA